MLVTKYLKRRPHWLHNIVESVQPVLQVCCAELVDEQLWHVRDKELKTLFLGLVSYASSVCFRLVSDVSLGRVLANGLDVGSEYVLSL